MDTSHLIGDPYITTQWTKNNLLPLKLYIYMTFKSWLENQLSRNYQPGYVWINPQGKEFQLLPGQTHQDWLQNDPQSPYKNDEKVTWTAMKDGWIRISGNYGILTWEWNENARIRVANHFKNHPPENDMILHVLKNDVHIHINVIDARADDLNFRNLTKPKHQFQEWLTPKERQKLEIEKTRHSSPVGINLAPKHKSYIDIGHSESELVYLWLYDPKEGRLYVEGPFKGNATNHGLVFKAKFGSVFSGRYVANQGVVIICVGWDLAYDPQVTYVLQYELLPLLKKRFDFNKHYVFGFP